MSFFKKLLKSVNRLLGLKKSRRKPVTKKRSKAKSKKTFRTKAVKKAPALKVKKVVVKAKPAPRAAKIAQTLKAPPKNFVATKSVQKVKEIKMGGITHYFDRIGVAVVRIDSGQIAKGDTIFIRGNKTGELRQKVASMQVESVDVPVAKKGQLIGLKVSSPVHVGDEVFMAIGK